MNFIWQRLLLSFFFCCLSLRAALGWVGRVMGYPEVFPLGHGKRLGPGQSCSAVLSVGERSVSSH